MFFFVLAAVVLAALFLIVGVLFAMDESSSHMRTKVKTAFLIWYCRYQIWKHQRALIWEFGPEVLLQTPKHTIMVADNIAFAVYWLGFDASDPDHRPALRQWYSLASASSSLLSFVKALIAAEHPSTDTLVIAMADRDGNLDFEEEKRLELFKERPSLVYSAVMEATCRGRLVLSSAASRLSLSRNYNFRPSTSDRHQSVEAYRLKKVFELTIEEEMVIMAAIECRYSDAEKMKILSILSAYIIPKFDCIRRIEAGTVCIEIQVYDKFGTRFSIPFNNT